VVGLQEVEGKDAVWRALAEAVGADYRYDYYEAPTSGTLPTEFSTARLA
jgi:hypothetical protein